MNSRNVISFCAGLEQQIDTVLFKERDLTVKDHVLRHLGGPLGVAATSAPGQRGAALKESAVDAAKNTYGGLGAGAATGALAGSAVLAHNVAKHGVNGMAKRSLLKAAAKGGRFKGAALAGAALGGYAGLVAGSVRGTHGAKQREIQKKYHAYCAALEETLDTVLFRNREDEEAGMGGTIAKAAVGGATGAGAVLGDRAIMRRHGTRGLLDQGASGPMGSHNMAPRAMGGTAQVGRVGAYRAAASSAGQATVGRLQSGLRAGRHAAHVIAEDGQGTVKSLLGGLRKGVRVAARR